MKIKTVVFTIILFLVCASLFANEQSKALMAKAKQCETQKKYASALGYYYDAVVADPEENEDAYDAFQKLSNRIMLGQPGFGNYNEFTFYDNWVLLLKDAEAYWTANSPYVFYFSDLKKQNVNYEKRTADYSCEIQCDYSEKYKAIVQNAIMPGIKMAMTDSWGDLKEWPMISAFTSKDGTPAQIYQKYGAAIVNYRKGGVDIAWKYCEAKLLEFSEFDSQEMKQWEAASFEEKNVYVSPVIYNLNIWSMGHDKCYLRTGVYGCAALTVPQFFDQRGLRYVDKSFGFSDIKLSIVDENGKTLFYGSRASVPTIKEEGKSVYAYKDCNTYMFCNVPSTIMDKIENNECHIAVGGAFVNYGDYNPMLEDFYTRKSVNNLPDITLSVKQFENENVSLDSIVMKIKEKEALEARKRSELTDKLYSTAKNEISKTVCLTIKNKKEIRELDLLLFVNNEWKKFYDDQEAQIDKEDKVYFPNFDKDFANKFFEEEIKGKLYTMRKDGTLVLTKEGMQLLKKK